MLSKNGRAPCPIASNLRHLACSSNTASELAEVEGEWASRAAGAESADNTLAHVELEADLVLLGKVL